MELSIDGYSAIINEEFKGVVSKEVSVSEKDMASFFEICKREISTTLISQFGLSQFFDHYQNGGNVDTVHNVREGVYATDAENKAYANRGDYSNDSMEVKDKKTGELKIVKIKDAYHQHPEYKRINKEYSKQKEAGGAVDAYTGEKFSTKAKTDLDHVVSAKEVHDDPGRILAELDGPELADTESNLKLTNMNLNRYKNKYTVDETLEKITSRDFEKERDKINTNSNLTQEEKELKLKKLRNVETADKEKMEKYDKDSRGEIDEKINDAYYKGAKFKENVKATSLNQGFSMAKKQAIGIVIYEFTDSFWEFAIPFATNWSRYSNMSERVSAFNKGIVDAFEQTKNRLKDSLHTVAEGAFSGFMSGVVSNIITVAINTFATTAKSFAKILNDGIHGIIRAIKLLCSKPADMTREQAVKEAIKILSVTITASIGMILTEHFKVYLTTTPLAPLADIIATTCGAMLIAIVSAGIIYTFDNFGEIIKKISTSLRDIKYGLTVSAKEIKYRFEKAISKIDDAYHEILTTIKSEYERLSMLTNLAYDFSTLVSVQFNNSQEYAMMSGVKQDQILKNLSDVDSFFLN